MTTVNGMAKTSKQIEREIQTLKSELAALASKKEPVVPEGSNMAVILRYMTEERERTNKILSSITAKITKMEHDVQQSYTQEENTYDEAPVRREVALSALDIKIVNYVQSKEMACADEVKAVMGYKGKNAACNRLNKLREKGLLERFQLGHKVYYKYDAGKATNILIISPPQ